MSKEAPTRGKTFASGAVFREYRVALRSKIARSMPFLHPPQEKIDVKAATLPVCPPPWVKLSIWVKKMTV
jgi:hypothetical protein